MAIVKLRKLTLYGRTEHRDQVLLDLQQLGCMHLIDLPGKPAGSVPGNDADAQPRQALKYLVACPEQRPPATHGIDYDPHSLTSEALANAEAQRRLRDEAEELRSEIKTIVPWGDFQLPAPEQLGGQRFWFYRLTHNQRKQFSPTGYSVRVSSDNQYEYWLVIAPDEPVNLPVKPVTLDPRSLSELRGRLEWVENELESLHLARIAMTRWSAMLSADIAATEDLRERHHAAMKVLGEAEIFAIQGWVAESSIPALSELAAKRQLALTIIAPAPGDTPPTLFKNPQWIAGAEGAVTFYMTPSYRAWDPTWVMYLSFSLFFAMIMADAGYGIWMGVMLLLLGRRLASDEGQRRLLSLAIFMSVITTIYGVIIGSYFGFSPPADSLLGHLVWRSGERSIMEDRETMMFISAAIGVCHLSLANLISAWQRRGTGRALSHIGWVLSLLGGLLIAVAKLPRPAVIPWLAEQLSYSAATVNSVVANTGITCLISGLFAIFLFTSERPVFSTRLSDWLWRPLEGLLGLTNISKAFGDALSYLRLFALGLASAQLAITFNSLAEDVSQVRGIGLFLGLMVFIAGHTLNFVLGIVGGVVHGLRLNCIEFFGWSLTDEGYPFQAFRTKAKR
jgi:V/A-type H+/Na+-transporting ATPase subunit I